MQFRSLLNGVLMQEKDLSIQGKADLEPMTDKQPTASEVEDLLFANKIVKNSKSNAMRLGEEQAALRQRYRADLYVWTL